MSKASHIHPILILILIPIRTHPGLGIVNKTSLKIYNDPFSFFALLKSCLSGLIDAGQVPENERHNQPKKTKRSAQNKDELKAFADCVAMLVDMMDRGDQARARQGVQEVCAAWHSRQKSVRSSRFVIALGVLHQ
ncbi:hypothetical protein EON64_15425, partial [archaeon]